LGAVFPLRFGDEHHQWGAMHPARGNTANDLPIIKRQFGQPPVGKTLEIMGPVTALNFRRCLLGGFSRCTNTGLLQALSQFRLDPAQWNIREIAIYARVPPPVESSANLVCEAVMCAARIYDNVHARVLTCRAAAIKAQLSNCRARRGYGAKG
jgi:hypothetical protein